MAEGDQAVDEAPLAGLPQPTATGRLSFAQVVPDTASVLPTDVFTYSVPDDLTEVVVTGSWVQVPFGRREVMGLVVGRLDSPDRPDARPIAALLDAELLLPYQVALAHYVAKRYCAPLGEVVKAMLPKGVRAKRKRAGGPRTTSRALAASRAEYPDEAIAPELTEAQQAAAAPLLAAVADGSHRRVLLHGVTGSGKTEVYLTAITATIAAGRQAIVLVPEIALTPQTIRRFAGRFPGRVAVLHSGLTDAERAQQWRRIRAGECDVVVGSRSAVFAPLPQLGLVVIDEEDSSAYKQDRIPRYHAVDVALELGQLCDCPVVLGSATPRIETYYAAHTGGLELVTLEQRIGGRELPPIEVVDLREELRSGNFSPLSLTLQRALARCRDEGGQSILFLNRRGSATVVMCRSCGVPLACANCSVSMVYHHSRRRCDCHYCGATAPLPERCAGCNSTHIKQLGMGTERLETAVHELFPELRLLRMDRDTTQTRDAYFGIYERFRAGEADCLIGTQMIAKGWDLANVRLVGIVNADGALHFPDYRSGEVTFSLITQVAGRAGRGGERAEVILQTYSPEHYAVRHAMTHDYRGFAHEEIRIRRALSFPPYSRMVVCTVTHADDQVCEAEARECAAAVSDSIAGRAGLAVLGPTPAFLHRLRGEYRWQFTLRGDAIERAFDHLPQGRGKHGGAWSIDVDPAS